MKMNLDDGGDSDSRSLEGWNLRWWKILELREIFVGIDCVRKSMDCEKGSQN